MAAWRLSVTTTDPSPHIACILVEDLRTDRRVWFTAELD